MTCIHKVQSVYKTSEIQVVMKTNFSTKTKKTPQTPGVLSKYVLSIHEYKLII